MKNFEVKLEYLEDAVFEKEDFSKAQHLILDMIKDDSSNIKIDDFIEFLSLSSDAIDVIEESSLFDDVTNWALSKYNEIKSSGSPISLEYADAINTWINHKIELVDDPSDARESRISLNLFTDIIEGTSPDKAAEVLTNDYQGYATYSLLVGLSDGDNALIDSAVAAQRKVMDLYATGKFPDYYNLRVFMAGSKRALASTLMEAYEFDNHRYSHYYEEIGTLLCSAISEFEDCGTDFDKEYTSKLLRKYESYTP